MAKILIVDDNETNLKILSLILKKDGYDVVTLKNPESFFEILTVDTELVLLDINMPVKSGFDLCLELKENDKFKNIPIIFISALSDSEDIVKGFSYGAVDYITKPFKAEEVRARVSTHINLFSLQRKLEDYNQQLEQTVQEHVKKISDIQMETIFSLAKLAQSRDDDTGTHLERVQNNCYIIAKKLQENPRYKDLIDDTFISNLVNASTLHDIGKVGIPDAILLKPGPLTNEEFEEMKKHTIIGAETLEEVDSKFGGNSFVEMGIKIARSHHERWDGLGYPDGLKGDEIPLEARILSVADVYDALGTKRSYKDAFPQEKCISIIVEKRGTQFDPYVVDAFLEVADELYKQRELLEHVNP